MSFETTSGKIKKAINDFSLLAYGDSVLVGFSGGKDSVVLLHALHSMSKEYGIQVYALHVNHNIRGDEALRDESFCKKFCEERNIPFTCTSVDAVSFSKENGLGLEEGARKLRYGAFYDFCCQNNITKIATAHTASDNLETVLFNLTRGCASTGLRGIPPVRDRVIRPLIYCTTDEILEYARVHSLDFVTDSTNNDTDYSRNRIRHNVIPQLKELNPSVENAVSNMCDSLRLDVDYIKNQTDREDTDVPSELSKLHPTVLNRLIIKKYDGTSPDTQLESTHVREIAELIRRYTKEDCRETKSLSLPGKINFVITKHRCFFEKDVPSVELKERKLVFGLNEFEETGEALLVTQDKDELEKILCKNIYKISIHTIVKKSILADTIIRKRIDGDVFTFSNMTKKVKKMLNEAKIPLNKRDRLPIICDKKGIIWIAGFPVRDDARPASNSETVQIYYLTKGE